MDSRKDKVIRPNKHYFSSRMWAKEREETTLYIQCRVRAWFARRRADDLRKLRDDKDAELMKRQEELRVEEENKRKVEIERRLHPKKGKDFDVLFNELEARLSVFETELDTVDAQATFMCRAVEGGVTADTALAAATAPVCERLLSFVRSRFACESACVFVCVDDAVMYAERERFDTLSRKRRG